jgi:hypothetical protein
MGIFKKTVMMLGCLALFAISAHASATNVYIAQNGAGAANGADCADALPVSFFNNSGNWGSGPNQIGPGTTVHLCGTFNGAAGSSMLTIQGSGASGSPITILFESGAQLNAPYWGDNAYSGGPGAITCSGFNYITVDGGVNGVIQNTSDGTGLATPHNSTGVFFQDCSNPTIKNLTIKNIYVKTSVTDENEYGVGLWLVGGNNWLITNNTITHAVNGMSLGWDGNNTTTSNNVISYNTVDYGCHLINGPGDSNTGYAASNFLVDHNTLGPHQSIWQDPNQSCHGDGLGPSGAFQSGSSVTNFTISNNMISSDMCALGGNCTAPIFVSQATNLNIFNNIVTFVNGGNGEALIRLSTTIDGTPETNVSIYQNTLVGPVGSQTGIKINAITNLVAKNNIFQNLGQAWWDNTGGNFSQFSSGSATNFNDYYNMASNIGSGSTHYTSLSSWQGAGFDPNATTGNPMLNNSFVPQSGSAVLGLGANLTGLSLSALNTDRAGIQRPASGPWAAGVYQSTGSLPAPPSNVIANVQ